MNRARQRRRLFHIIAQWEMLQQKAEQAETSLGIVLKKSDEEVWICLMAANSFLYLFVDISYKTRVDISGISYGI